jgi:hypothetical protein
MKTKNKSIILSLGIALVMATSCTDAVKFGNDFLEKAPGGSSATIDTVFNSATYTRQFLTTIYSLQYYGLPYNHHASFPYTYSNYQTKFDCFTDTHLSNFSNEGGSSTIYNGTLTSNSSFTNMLYDYRYNNCFEAIRYCWILIENISKVPDMTDAEKASCVAQARCLLAAKYFDMFRFYGGLPIITSSFSGTDGSYNLPRGTVKKTVDFMISQLNQAIGGNKGEALPWQYSSADLALEEGHWTKAGAMALKCKIWAFAASPLFNSDKGYYGGTTDAEKDSLVWCGGYHAELWDSLYNSCKSFFSELQTRGGYSLTQASDDNNNKVIDPQEYCNAYRRGYAWEDSKEILHSTRVVTTDAYKTATYVWHQWQAIGRCSTNPTWEFMCMFPWANGKNFDWDDANTDKVRDTIFAKGTFAAKTLKYTRDPRLYETLLVTGEMTKLDRATSSLGGVQRELWVGGGKSDASKESAVAQGPVNEATSQFGTGFGNNKYYMGDDNLRQYCQWDYLRLSDIILTYAEAKLQAKNDYNGCIELIDQVRARVGMKGLKVCNPSLNLTSKDVLLNQLLRERACELGLEDTRYFDLIRYKRADIFQQPIHKMLTYRLNANGSDNTQAWRGMAGGEKDKVPFPTHFRYEVKEVKRTRVWWTQGYDPKWYLEPWPLTEINKGYGLVQNPGW